MSANPAPDVQPDYEVIVQLVDGTHAVPDIPPSMSVGQTVRYSSPAGTVSITFDQGSPFQTSSGEDITVIPDSTILLLQKAGDFFCRCFITLPSGQTVGWFAGENPQSGGDHHVGH